LTAHSGCKFCGARLAGCFDPEPATGAPTVNRWLSVTKGRGAFAVN
jgi:hypothetical protein